MNILLLVFLALIGWGGYGLLKYTYYWFNPSAVPIWKMVKAKIIDGHPEEEVPLGPLALGGARHAFMRGVANAYAKNTWVVVYEYTVNGKTYTEANGVSLEKKSRYHVGASVKILYDPRHPERSSLEEDSLEDVRMDAQNKIMEAKAIWFWLIFLGLLGLGMGWTFAHLNSDQWAWLGRALSF